MPSWLLNLVVGAIFGVISFYLAPKPKGPKAAELDDIKVPQSNEGDEIGIIVGTRWVAPQIAWWGDFRSEAIKDRQGKK